MNRNTKDPTADVPPPSFPFLTTASNHICVKKCVKQKQKLYVTADGSGLREQMGCEVKITFG